MSDLEDELYRQVIAAGLPEPIREHRFAQETMGRMWRWDLCWPDKLIAVEVDGGGWSNGRHTRGSGFEKDMEKQNAGTIIGYRLLRFGGKLIKSGEAVALISELFARLEETDA